MLWGLIQRYVIQFEVAYEMLEDDLDSAWLAAAINMWASGETRASTGQPRTTGRRGSARVRFLGLRGDSRVRNSVRNTDDVVGQGSVSLLDSDERFGLLDRTMVRRYGEYESVHAVLRCEAPVLCAHSLNAQTQPRRQHEGG